ncbi:hypothetical protein [Candidatus Enterococcus mansonii]|uniref:Uncharacterized protein n=1 Tax=Candidatus Enterococcus mansonii TaxID=1834181 RepID=A0A242CJI7_9ENTE|nr:hypothetical protein [Enterococcus sp. 4G2_DIV0659]OTO10319.1 hypothetical protein A5880_001003 [Enterococcus sp. 4G2_DIV0659]
MYFNTTFLPTDFTENKLKVLSLVKLLVQVKETDGTKIEEFQTDPSEKIYTIKTELAPTMKVEVTLVPDETIEFYPVVTAL